MCTSLLAEPDLPRTASGVGRLLPKLLRFVQKRYDFVFADLPEVGQ